MRNTAIAIFLVGGAGCFMPPAGVPAQWQKTPALRAAQDKFLPAMEAVLARRGFVVETRDAYFVRVVSRWRVHLHPERWAGYRHRVTMQMELNDKRQPLIAVMAERSLNEAGVSTLSESTAEWGMAYGDDDLAREMALLLRMKIDGVQMDD